MAMCFDCLRTMLSPLNHLGHFKNIPPSGLALVQLQLHPCEWDLQRVLGMC